MHDHPPIEAGERLKHTFKKAEKLRSRSIIDRLFRRNNSEIQTFYVFPYRVLYIKDSSTATAGVSQVLFSVSKRSFKRAVDRNLIRRRCREAYRRHKHLLAQSESTHSASIAFLYLAKEISPYDVMEKSMLKILTKMSE